MMLSCTVKLHVKHYHMSSAQFRRRASMLGLPGEFGDLIFVDHEEIKFGNKAYLALVIIDGASNLLGLRLLPVWKRQRLRELFVNGLRRTSVFQRELSEIKHFFTDQFMAYYKFHGITPYPCGPCTPWPNRAETAVRLFKRTWSIMGKALADEGYAEKVTVRQAVKKVAWARNCQLTVSGYSPLEIATGRRPP